MSGAFKSLERKLLVALLAATFAATVTALLSLLPCIQLGSATSSDLFATAGLLAALTGFVQIDVTGFFEKLIEHYSNETEYPFGPPSRITRQIIDNPDRPIRTAIRNHLYFRPGTGFWIVIGGTALQIIALWV